MGKKKNIKDIKEIVKEGYAKVAKQSISCCGPTSSCYGGATLTDDISKRIGYSEEEIKGVPEGANLGLGCGNPVALASLKEGDTVLHLGSGAGFDCFLAANKVGKKGKVIGVDMTPEMIEKANNNVKKSNYRNVEFRRGDIEKLPVDDDSVDVVMSNCVINLSPDKSKFFKEAFRALKPGGRLTISDIVLLKELPEFVKENIEAYIGCVSGAILKSEYLGKIETAGIRDVRVIDETAFPIEFITNDPTVKGMMDNCLKVTLAAGQLGFVYNGIATPLAHWHYDAFNGGKADDPTFKDMKLNFQTDVNGNVVGVAVPLESTLEAIYFAKKPDARLSDPAYLKTLAGSYTLAPQTVTVALRGNVLTLSVPGQPVYDLVPEVGGEFSFKTVKAIRVKFLEDAKGNATGLEIIQPSGVYEYKRTK